MVRHRNTGDVPLLRSEKSSDSDDFDWADTEFVHLVRTTTTKQITMQRRLKVALAVIIGAVVIFVLGLVIGLLIARGDSNVNGTYLSGVSKNIIRDGDPSIQQKLLKEINSEKIRQNLKEFTLHPHLAGTEGSKELAERIRDIWTEYGFDHVKLQPYDVLLSYPNTSQPNTVVLYDGTGRAKFTSQLAEKVLSPDQSQPDVVPPFNAYSVAGNPRGQLVYVNYGRYEDFNWLNKTTDISGKLCLARYGMIFRGDKVKFGEEFGCKGMILYSDPANYAPDTNVKVFPETWWLPGTGVQRGTLLIDKGDPQTLGYPSISSAYRISEEDIDIPKIPSHPIGYDDAQTLLRNLAGKDAPDKWQGAIPGIKYKLGPGFVDSSWQVQLNVQTYNIIKTVYNVIGTIRGDMEPDRYVLLGNHRDAWVFGAVDPTSGTAAMVELSRVFGKLVKEGWRPRRSLMFCSWGAEEYGLVGSTEWVEHFTKSLGERAVAYLNVDIAVQGNHSIQVKGTPLLSKVLHEAAKLVPNPNTTEVGFGKKTLYDKWAQFSNSTVPTILVLGSGSDYASFVTCGITSADFYHTYDEVKLKKLSSYPLYHSVYETFSLMNDIIDPTFKYHAAVTQYWGEVARSIADTYILPFDVRDYGNSITGFVNSFIKEYGTLLEKHNISVADLKEAADIFSQSCQDFHSLLPSINRNNPLDARKASDQMMQLERAFTDPNGLPGRPRDRHIIYAPSSTDNYSGVSLPGLVDALFEIEDDPNQKKRWETFKKHLSVVTYTFLSAASTLADVANF
ncbi:N-acetylated-alpha-linked acidic dipeptidase 2-like isoform X2 [Tubulanus polymorphus]|uniref:N-acetylated-alpha-linked acidic dipeptidase 2-like isoform X2 n=1 Tax=Tubulanus polymorphus TaxID=672921 RepID=UPI003DA57B24